MMMKQGEKETKMMDQLLKSQPQPKRGDSQKNIFDKSNLAITDQPAQRQKNTSFHAATRPTPQQKQQVINVAQDGGKYKQQKTQTYHPFDLLSSELYEIKALFPEFKVMRKANDQKIKGLEIGKLREALVNKIPVSNEMLDKIISQIDRKSDGTVFWNEFLDSLTQEGKIRETIADAYIFGFGVKRLQYKDSFSLKASEFDKTAEHCIHQLVLIQNDTNPLIIGFFEDQKVKCFDAQTMRKISDIKFPSEYGVAKPREQKEKQRELKPNAYNQRSTIDNFSSITSNTSKLDLQANLKFQLKNLQDTQLESIAENQPKQSGQRSKSNLKLNKPIVCNLGQSMLALPQKKIPIKRQITVLNQQRSLTMSLIQQQSSSIEIRQSKQNFRDLDKSMLSCQSESSQRNTTNISLTSEPTSALLQQRKKLKSAFVKENPYQDNTRASKIASNVQQSLNQSVIQVNNNQKRYASQPKINFKNVANNELQNAQGQQKEDEDSTQIEKHRITASPDVIEWKNKNSFHHKALLRKKEMVQAQIQKQQNAKMESKILGLVDLMPKKETFFASAGSTMEEDVNDKQMKSGNEQTELRKEFKRNQVMFQHKIADISKQNKETDQLYEKKWLKLFKEGVQEHNKYNNKTVEKAENKTGYDYFSAPQIALNVTKRLAFEIKDVQEARTKREEQMIAQFEADQSKCESFLSSINTRQRKITSQLENRKEINQFYYPATNEEELATLGIKMSKELKRGVKTEADEEKFSEFIKKIKAEQLENQTGHDFTNLTSLQLELKKRKKIKLTKEVYCIGVDYHKELGYVAIALIDREVSIFRVKNNANKVQVINCCKFRAHLPNKSTISSINIEKYVTNGRPILIIGSFHGDIIIYQLAIDPNFENMTESEKIASSKEPQIIRKFNFFDKNLTRPTKIVEGSTPAPVSQRMSFDQNQNIMKKSTYASIYVPNLNIKSYESQSQKSQEQPQSNYQQNVNTLVEATKQIQDNYWELLVNTREKKEGPDGIKLWNQLVMKIKNQEHCMMVCKLLLENKIDWAKNLETVVTNWNLCMRLNADNATDALEAFKPQLFKIMKKDSSARSSVQQDKSKIKNDHNSPGLKDEADEQKTRISQKYKDKDLKAKENEITKIRYQKDIGLIATTFDGTIKIFDAFNFNQIWKSTNKNRAEQLHTNIVTFDVSSNMGLMATGGAEGRLVLIDPYALGIINGTIATKNKEIINVFCFDEQQQIITVAEDRTICLWDAYRLIRIQYIKDMNQSFFPKFTSSTFDKEKGMLYVGCQQISTYKAVVDSQIEIDSLQVQTLSKAKALEQEMENQKGLQKMDQTHNADECTGKALISNKSTLVELLINDCSTESQMNYLVTVDSENLLRGWSLRDTSTLFSYKIELADRVTAAAIDEKCKIVVVGSCTGQVRVINFRSGGVLYELPRVDKEVTSLKFLNEKSEFWIVGGCWSGKIVLWTKPTDQNHFQITAKCRIGHRGDILSLNSSELYFVSGGTDGYLSVWSQFTGVMKYALTNFPDPKNEKTTKQNFSSLEQQNCDAVGRQIRKTIVGLLFHPYYKNLVFMMQEGGDIHGIDIQNGEVVSTFLAHVQVNSSWAIDNENMRVFVCGDLGNAIFFDVEMGAKELKKKQKSQKISIPVFSKEQAGTRWQVVKFWWTAHVISKNDPFYVSSCQFSKSSGLFITGTANGEIKLWSAIDCSLVGMLNSKDWNGPKILRHIKKWRSSIENEEISQL